ncbi:MAG: NAD-glutamate dehydrogenase [Caulobacterales bacterium]|nr:NAD-glutamate dehydrogenase [Caulobacterales bacterium]
MDGETLVRDGATLSTESLQRAFAAAAGLKAPDPAAQDFIRQAAADCAPEELPGLTDEDVGTLLAGLWNFGRAFTPGQPAAVRLRRALGAGERDLGFDVLEIAQDDRPFLVDSVMSEVADGGFVVRAMVHPIVGGVSMIQVHLDSVGDDRAPGLVQGMDGALLDVRRAVDDFGAMRSLMERSRAELAASPEAGGEAVTEALAFLDWLNDDHFVFLGARVYDYPRDSLGGYAAEEPLFEPEASLGVLRDPERMVLRRGSEPAVLSAQLRRQIEIGAPLTVAKSNLLSRVHRRGYMDYIGVRRYGDDGKPSGEVRFVGLFTAEAYEEPARDVPLIRRKVALVLQRSGAAHGGHNEKRLRNILETWPRDELFQSGEDELLSMALGVLHLYDRPRVRLFARRDPFDRFVSVILFTPRDRYGSGLRQRAGDILSKAFGGRVSAYYPSFSEQPLARVHFIIGVTPGDHAEPDLAAIEAEIAEAARTWEDRFEAAVRDGAKASGVAATAISAKLAAWGEAFPPGYRDQYDAAEALIDLAEVEALEADGGVVRVRAFRRAADSALTFRFKLYRPKTAAPLADVLPILERMGLKAMIEEGFKLSPRAPENEAGARDVWVHEFILEDERGEHLSFDDVRDAFEEAFVAVWTGQIENDGFNRLVLELGLPPRDAALIRALAGYRRQSGLDPSREVQEEALSAYPGVARLILDLFRLKFDPAIRADVAARTEQAKALEGEIAAALQGVASLDADRALRRIAALVGAIQRTNFYQRGPDGAAKPYISFKVASRELADLPAPKPYREIYVAAPHIEGVHTRFGPVARGGLRWSDRRDDFRTEVLSLVKAQQVKNAVIVPVGAKGCFYPKAIPAGAAPDVARAEAVRAYKTFLSGLLDITDNLDAAGQPVRPEGVIAHDGDDPYLVVAADKGTATFSDIANGVAEDYGFWLGDAFASGGSAGYDHKGMGITARGAWEAVKRHFRELGKDIQAEPFTCVGVGDMSGDVFGNGMLLSEQTRLVAAFDHRHIFIDPDPDAAVSFKERARLFALPRSSWDDYDKSLISAGGGVYPRSLKAIPLSAEARALLDIKVEAPDPFTVMTAILKARAELLYFGGIGNYVKASRESHAQAGDKANDAIRIDGAELRVKVVGEGANLGMTQAGRIEYAQAGGRLNTDAIDNSAGVDTSDHEVNIKILVGQVERAGGMTREERDVLLASMTDDVAAHVLAHNYDQTLALSLMQADGVGAMDAYAGFMADLEQRGRLDRAVEGLPNLVAMTERTQAGQALTRPELAVLLAYGKLDLKDEIVAGAAPDDPWLEATLKAYFPDGLGRFEDEMKRHRLRREIVTMVVGNRMVNLCGPTFPGRLRAAAGCTTDALVAGFEAARTVLGIDDLWARVNALDGKAPAAAQLALYGALSTALRGQTYWLARRAKASGRGGVSIRGLVDAYGPAIAQLKPLTPGILSGAEREAVAKRAKAFVKAGAPDDLAQVVAALQPLTVTADLVDLAAGSSWPLENVARLYHQVGAAFAIDRLRAAAGAFAPGDSFERLAVRRLIEDLLAEQAQITGAIVKFAAGPQGGDTAEHAREAVKSWAALKPEVASAAKAAVEEIEKAGGGWSFAKLTIANAAVRELASGAGG